MSSVPRDILLRVQKDCYGRLLSSEFLANVAMLIERKAFTLDEIKQRLAALNDRGGKVGACVLVTRPSASPEADNGSGRSEVVITFLVLEHPTINAGDKGTGIGAEEIAVEIFDLFQMAGASQPEQVFAGYPGGAIVPNDSFPGLNAWEVHMRTFAALRRTTRLATPLITPDEGAAPQLVTIEASPGADIYYTLDKSYPFPGNAQAILYAAPFNQAAAATVRAAAYQSGFQPSSIAEATFD